MLCYFQVYSYICTYESESVIYIYTYIYLDTDIDMDIDILFQILFHYSLLQDSEYSSLC